MFEMPEELTLDKIDWDWVQKCNKPAQLKKALFLLEQDGGYFQELMDAIKKKLVETDPVFKKKLESQKVDPAAQKEALEIFEEWEASTKRMEANKKIEKNIFDEAAKDNAHLTQDEKNILADRERTKGNEAVRSKDWKEALQYYTKSISFNDKVAASYSNRALVYLKLKDWKSALNDSNKALDIDPKYTKALHRRGKAKLELKEYEDAITDFQKILEIEPNNQEVNADLMDARAELNKQNSSGTKSTEKKSTTAPQSNTFKRIAIQEEDEDDEEEEEEKGKTEIKETEITTEKSKGVSKLEQTNSTEKKSDGTLSKEEEKRWNEYMKEHDTYKDQGVADISNGMFNKAVKSLEKALNLLNSLRIPAKLQEINAKKASCLNNIALCYMQEDIPESVIKYTTQCLEIKGIDDTIKIKALIRRGLAYEKLDKLRLARNDYVEVKHLNPGNKQASEGLHRVDKLLIQEDPAMANKKELEEIQMKKNVSAKADLLEELEKEKNAANQLFKAGDLRKAKDAFQSTIEKVEKSLKEIERGLPILEKYNVLYVQLLSNRALTSYNLKEISDSLADCNKALVVDPKHEKCLYRRALCHLSEAQRIAPGDKEHTEDVLSKQYQIYELAAKDLEDVIKINNTNQDTKEKLSDLKRTMIQLKLKLKDLEANKSAQPETEKEKEAKAKAAAISKEKLENITNKVVSSVTSELMSSDELPQTSSSFELNCNSFKKEISKLYFYLKRIPLEHLKKLYQKAELNPELLINIAKSIQDSGIKDNSAYCLELLETLAQTNRFNLCVKQTTKGEKKLLKEIIETLASATNESDRGQDLLEKYNCKSV